MTNEMIERVNNAVLQHIKLHTGSIICNLDVGRVAIAAMREPTEEMKNCSDEIHWGYSCNVCGGLKEGWYKMIDAVLK